MKGFTLIETVIYIALLGMLMTGTLMTAYDLFESSQKSSGKATVQEEGSFVQRKMTWALTGMTSAPTVGGFNCSQTLSVSKAGAATPVEFQRNSTNNTIEMREGGVGSFLPITTGNVSATCLQFSTIAASGSGPSGVTATLTISTLPFSVTKYVRK